ncbi:MAG: DegT/DnrJ/EryC1/StrS aminotransferase family protein [Candidatus Marinimicrobia bacterium]|nr:DegT/DnrJ/EryC1/StrS aminotransferase family protein [Candidatus Neomarinimicrobiota bacterium]
MEKDISIKLCVVIHPFGFEAPINPLLEILDKKKILLLEDCAQGVFSRYEENNLPFGGKGNFALYSLNKFLPVLDGAILLSHVNKINVSLNQNELTPINKKALDSYKKHLKNNREIFLNDDQNETRELIKKSSKQYDRYYEYISQDLGNHKLCSYSEELMESFDCEKLILSRKRNMSLIYNNLSNNKIQLLYHKNNKIVPMVVPARVFGGSRDKWIDKLSEKGVILAQQSDRWNFLSMTKDIKKYSNEGDFIKNHVLIPINEFIDEGKMCFMIESLNRMSL